MSRHFISLLVLAGLVGGPLSAQTFKQDISLAGVGNGNPGRSFGITYEPVTDRLFVGVCGTFGGPNNVVAILDPVSESLLGTIPVGLFPEDVAFVYDGGGQPLYGAVTNSSDGTVTLWDASDLPVATIPIPDNGGFGSYPFGIAPSADHSLLYVGTVNGTGDVFAIDVPTRAVDLAQSFNVGARVLNRLQTANGQMLLPWVEFLGGGSIAGLQIWDLGTEFTVVDPVLVPEDPSFSASAQDVAVLPDGSILVAGVGLADRLYQFAADGELLRTLRLDSLGAGGHGLALSSDGTLLAVCDFVGDALVLVDAVNLEVLSVTDLTQVGLGYRQPNDAVFVGGELYVTCQGSEEVLVFDDLPVVVPGPGFAGSLAVSDSTPEFGTNFQVTVAGPGKVALLAAFNDQPTVVQGVPLLIGPNPKILGGGQGSYSRTLRIPPQPALQGTNVFFQGVTDAGGLREPTTPRVVVVQ